MGLWKEEAAPPSIDLVHEDDVRHYFDAYARALTSGDAEAIAALWELPALMVSDLGVRAVHGKGEIAKVFAGAKGMYAMRGIVDTRPDIQSVTWLTARVVLADVRWPLFDGRHREVGCESFTYTLMRDRGGELKLRVLVMRGHTEHPAHH